MSMGKKIQKKGWKRIVTKPTFVGQDFTRRPLKYERFLRPIGLRHKYVNLTYLILGVAIRIPILSAKKNLPNPLYTQLGVLIKGTVEVNVSELGMTTTSLAKSFGTAGHD